MGIWKTSDVPLKELERELKRRNLSFDPKQEKVIPLPLETPDFAGVCDLCKEYVDALSAQGWADERFRDWITESAMRSVFGPRIWEWISENTND